MKNLKSLILNGGLLAVGAMILGFMAGSYQTMSTKLVSSSVTGYKYMTDSLDVLKQDIKLDGFPNGSYGLIAASSIIVIILVSLMMLLAIVNILISLNVIKNEKLIKILNIANAVLSLLTIVFVACTMIGINGVTNATLESMKEYIHFGYGIIINIILAAIALCISVFGIFASKKKA